MLVKLGRSRNQVDSRMNHKQYALSLALLCAVTLASGCGGSGGSSTSSPASPAAPPAGAPPSPPPPSPPPASPPGTGSAPPASTVPAQARAPWYAPTLLDASAGVRRSGASVVWGDYFERSEDWSWVRDEQQTQELELSGSSPSVAFDGVDLGDGVDSFMLRVKVPTGPVNFEVRIQDTQPVVVARCTVNSTLASGINAGDGLGDYVTVGCPADVAKAKGANKTLVVAATGSVAATRLNWVRFWARGTTQAIDSLHKLQAANFINPTSPNTNQAGAAVRTRAMLPAAGEVLSRSYGVWSPSDAGDCPKWMHDTYWVKADDGRIYPTWHPAVDFNPETGQYCTYGHEHGSDPRGSKVFALAGMPPFGYVNENHEPDRANLQRSEDHFGHKVLVANDFTFYDAQSPNAPRKCSLLVKIHVGTHSPDAFTNSAHEIHKAGQCEGLDFFSTRYFSLFGQPGMFKESEAEGCGLDVDPGVAPTPPNQPVGGVHRAIPTAACFTRGTQSQQIQKVTARSVEFWLTDFFGGNFYYTIANPSRYYESSTSNRLGRLVDLCYQAGHPLSKSQRCQDTVAASSSRVAWNDVRSSFRGTIHTNSHFSGVQFADSSATLVYTNAWGQFPSASPDPSRGIIMKQTVPRKGFHVKVDGQASRVPNADHSSAGRNGVRPPN